MVWEVGEDGCRMPPLNVATLLPSTKYSQSRVTWQAVHCQVNVVVLPMLVTGQGRPLLLRIENAPPPLHCIEPLGASTLCGSYWTWPQSNDVRCLAQWSCRLGGDVIQPWA